MKRNTRIIAVLLLVLLTISFFFLVLPVFNIPQFFDSLKSTDLTIFFLACMVMLISNAFSALRWSVLVAEVKAPKSAQFFNAFGINSLGQIAGLIVPSRIGNYAKVPLVMKLDTIPYESGLSAVNAETVIDLVYISLAGIVSLGILSVTLYSSFQFISLLFFLILVVALIVILFILYHLDHFNEIYEKIRDLAGQFGLPFWKRVPARTIAKVYELTRSTKAIFTNRECVIKSGFWTLIFQLIGILSFFLVIESIHVTLPFTVVFAIFTLSILAGIVSLIPGGLGASDLSQVVLLASQGVSLPEATNIVILWRIVMYLPVVLVIGIYLMRTKIRIDNLYD
jgi:glycosyltransferase 2 family protein